MEMALDAEPEPAPLSVRVRVPVGPVRGVLLRTRSVLIVIRGGAQQVVWCSAACVCVGTTGPVGVALKQPAQRANSS